MDIIREYDTLTFVDFLEMKNVVDNMTPEYSWRITHNNYPFEIVLDDGGKSVKHMRFSEEYFEEEEVICIAKSLANLLGIEYR